MLRYALLAGLATLAAAPATAAAFLVTIEAPRAQSSTSTFTYSGVEGFDARTNTGSNATTSFGTNFGTTGLTGQYSNVSVTSADQFGGANGNGQYALARENGSVGPVTYSLDLSTTQAQGINYFGAWISAIDSGNSLSFYKNGALLYTFNAGDVLAQFQSNPGASYYYGNPNGGANTAQAYGFVNFYDTDGTFDKVVFSENAADSGFESDNHTVGRYASTSGYTVAAVPEPATWAMMIGGFGMVGAALRRRRAVRMRPAS